MHEEKPSFYFNDIIGRFDLVYCETEADARSLCWDRDDRYEWSGAGIYYTEQDYHHCSGDTYYKILRMPDDDVMGLLEFCTSIMAKFTKEQLIEKGWIYAEPVS